jgi:phosphatidate cytidylyltransferase
MTVEPSPLAPPPTASRFSNLQLRVMTAAVGLPLVIALVVIGGWPMAIAVGVVAALAAAEFMHGFLFARMPLSAVSSQAPWLAIPAVTVAASHWNAGTAVAAAGFAVVAGALGFAPTNALGPRKPFRVLAGAILYVSLPLSALVLLRGEEGGRDWLFLALLATFAVDTGAYTVGKLFGRHRMAPKISPGKTWEGAAGGYAAGAAAVFLLARAFDISPGAGKLLPLALLVPVFAMAGDLFESFLKRRMGIKDASGFLPGHGGFLDRLDSIMFVVPLVYVFVRWAW